MTRRFKVITANIDCEAANQEDIIEAIKMIKGVTSAGLRLSEEELKQSIVDKITQWIEREGSPPFFHDILRALRGQGVPPDDIHFAFFDLARAGDLKETGRRWCLHPSAKEPTAATLI